MTQGLPEFDLDRFVPYRFAVIADRMSANLADQYRHKYGITVAEWRVLVNLAYSAGVSVRDIEWRVSLDRPKISRAVARLEARGLLTKAVDGKDRRLLKLALTEAGTQLVSELVPLAQAYQDDIEKRLAGKFAQLQVALDDLMKEFEA